MVPDPYRQPRFFEKLISWLAETPSIGAEDTLFALAEQDPRFYKEHNWQSSAFKLGTESAAFRLAHPSECGIKGCLGNEPGYRPHGREYQPTLPGNLA